MNNETKNNWLLAYSKNIFSQYGEDGIIGKVIEIIGKINPWCVEFGAWDGKHLSNTYHLMKDKGWSGVFIEGDPKKAVELQHTYVDNKKAYCLCRFVSFEGDGSLDSILKETKIPQDFGLLSIDIDGNDYHIWDSLKDYNPSIVVIEFNPSIPAHIDFIQPRDMDVNQGSSICSIVKLGKMKSYELISATSHNAVFVKKEFYSKFNIADNTPAGFKDKKYQSEIFQLYDGTIVVTGTQRFLWHGIKFQKKHFQVIPNIFRFYPGVMGPARFLLFRIWRKIIETKFF